MEGTWGWPLLSRPLPGAAPPLVLNCSYLSFKRVKRVPTGLLGVVCRVASACPLEGG